MVFTSERCEEIARHIAATQKFYNDLSEDEELSIYLSIKNAGLGVVDIQKDEASKEIKCALLQADKTCSAQYELPQSRPLVYLKCKYYS